MPPLRGLTCTVRATNDNSTLPEHAFAYEDGFVSAFLEVPDSVTRASGGGFRIELSSDEFVSPGMVMFVYIDGVYQGNKMVDGLGTCGDCNSTQANFRIAIDSYQTVQPDGHVIQRPWSFSPAWGAGIQGSAPAPTQAGPAQLPFQGRYAGTIDVIVKRLAPSAVDPYSASPYRLPAGGLDYFMGTRAIQPKPTGETTSTTASVGNPWSMLTRPGCGIFPLSEDAHNQKFPPYNEYDLNVSGSLSFQYPGDPKAPGINFGVQLGQGVPRYERIASPRYVDGPGKSFAKFHYQYRDTTALESTLNIRLRDPAQAAEKNRLAVLSKEALIEEVLGLKRGNVAFLMPTSQHMPAPVSNGPQQSRDPLAFMKHMLEANLQRKDLPQGSMHTLEKMRCQLLEAGGSSPQANQSPWNNAMGGTSSLQPQSETQTYDPTKPWNGAGSNRGQSTGPNDEPSPWKASGGGHSHESNRRSNRSSSSKGKGSRNKSSGGWGGTKEESGQKSSSPEQGKDNDASWDTAVQADTATDTFGGWGKEKPKQADSEFQW